MGKGNVFRLLDGGKQQQGREDEDDLIEADKRMEMILTVKRKADLQILKFKYLVKKGIKEKFAVELAKEL